MSNNKKSSKKPVSKAVNAPKKPVKKPTKKKLSRPQTTPVVKTEPVVSVPESKDLDLDLVPKWETESATFDHQDDELEPYPTTSWGRVKLSIMDFFKNAFK
jgi:hypothetical protein